jgi:zinc transport system ATP-binding protein
MTNPHVDHSHNLIELHNISFSYGKNQVLKNVDLNVHKGDYLGIIGPNGGGKTTILKIMLGLLEPSEGEVIVFGKSIKETKSWTKISYVPQKAIHFEASFPATVEEVVSMGRIAKRGIFRFPTKYDQQKVHEALEHVGMLDHKDSLIGNLSGGQQQRVFIARALAAEPEIIFLDEPTVGIDIQNQEEFYQLLSKLNSELHKTLVLVSHDIDVVTNEVTEIACINQSLVYHGTPKEFIKEDYIERLYGKGVKFIVHGH